MRKRFLIIVLVIAVIVAGGLYVHNHHDTATSRQTTTTPASKDNTKQSSASTKSSDFDKTQYSLTDPTSIWVVVNKQRPLDPKTYIPSDLVVPDLPMRVAGTQLRQVTATAMTTMFAAAKQDGAAMKISSGYRSYTYQVNLYNGYVKTEGQSQADQESARPGYSEHQTGFAADLAPADGSCSVEQCFATTTAGKWLAANAYKYGFIVRYPDGLTNITGYEYEPWHVRYIGVDLATEMHKQGIQTLEQFFGLPSAPDYQ